MGMGSCPNHGFSISIDNLRKLCPDELAELETQLEKEEGISLDDFALSVCIDCTPTDKASIAYEKLQDAFKAKTNLELEIYYYNEDDGDRYDDMESGVNFLVHGVKDYTPAGLALKDMIEEKLWTVYG